MSHPSSVQFGPVVLEQKIKMGKLMDAGRKVMVKAHLNLWLLSDKNENMFTCSHIHLSDLFHTQEWPSGSDRMVVGLTN